MWAYQFAMLQAVAEKNGWTKFVSMQVSLCLSLIEMSSLADMGHIRTTTICCIARRSVK